MLTLKNVQKYYEGFHLNCSLTVPTGCITGLIGQNGAGKSTMFKAILNLISIDSGEIRLFNQDLSLIHIYQKFRKLIHSISAIHKFHKFFFHIFFTSICYKHYINLFL